MAKTVPCFINAYKYSYFGANWWLFGWSADALIALFPGCTYIYTYSLKPVAQMYSSMGVSLHLMAVVRSIEV